MTSDVTRYKEQQREQWSRAAGPWLKWHEPFAEMSRDATEAIVGAAGLADGMRVLDLASGTGEPSLAVGPDGTPHVAFHDWTLGALKLASGRDVLGVRTVAPSDVTTSGARLHGEVTALGPYAVANASFEWRREGDAAWSIVEALPDSEGATFEAHVGGLAPGTTYEFRAVAEAGGASAYGRIITFLTTAPERVDLYPMFFTGLSIAVLAAGVGLALWIWFLHPARVTRRGGRRPGGSV